MCWIRGKKKEGKEKTGHLILKFKKKRRERKNAGEVISWTPEERKNGERGKGGKEVLIIPPPRPFQHRDAGEKEERGADHKFSSHPMNEGGDKKRKKRKRFRMKTTPSYYRLQHKKEVGGLSHLFRLGKTGGGGREIPDPTSLSDVARREGQRSEIYQMGEGKGREREPCNSYSF